MGSVPVMHVFTTGEVVTASNLNNNTVTLASFVLSPPYSFVRQTSGQNLTSGSFTPLTWSAADKNTDSMWSAGAPTRLTSNTPGWFEYSGAWTLVAGTATGRRLSCPAINGTQVNGGQITVPAAGSASGICPERPLFMNVTDYMELQALQDSGGTVATGSASAITQAWLRGKWATQ